MASIATLERQACMNIVDTTCSHKANKARVAYNEKWLRQVTADEPWVSENTSPRQDKCLAFPRYNC